MKYRFMPLSTRTTTVTQNGHTISVQALRHADAWQPALVCDRLGPGQSGPFDRPRASATTCSGKRRRPRPPCWAPAESAR
ncbi:hypothetical protein ACFSR9_05495 [Deinococcus taklimakanensis]|uniref:Transposase n=1 Tax=Deinococcus taklimakanensis TaxID=536443 RepID=A0ABW5P0W8_9DEIO